MLSHGVARKVLPAAPLLPAARLPAQHDRSPGLVDEACLVLSCQNILHTA